jgi:signal transduction histidine kinase
MALDDVAQAGGVGAWRTRLLALAAWALLAAGAGAAEHQYRVLVIHAARREAAMPVIVDRELQRTLGAALPGRLDYYSEYIDQQRFTQPGFPEALREFLKAKYTGQHIDLLIATSDAALGLIEASPYEPFTGVPVVFHTTRGMPAAAHVGPGFRPRPNSTGISAVIDLARTIPLALQLQPGTKRLFVVSGSSPWDRYYDTLAREQLRPWEGKLEITYLSGLAMPDLLARVSNLPADSILYPITITGDASGDRFLAVPAHERIVAAANVPSYAWTTLSRGTGDMGGSMAAPEVIAEHLAGLALRVLRGERPEDIPVATVVPYVDEVDWRQLRRWGIGEDRIPAGITVLHREPGLWERYKVHVVVATLLLLLQTALIVGLLVQKARRRRLEAALSARHRENQDLAGRLIIAQEEERARIARELHDDVSQQLAGFSIVLSGLQQRLRSGRDGAEETVAALQGRAAAMADSVRSLSHDLHSGALEHVGLVAALREQCGDFQSQQGLEVALDAAEPVGPVDPAVALCLYRVTQEALANVGRHSRGRKARVRLARTSGGIELDVSDDGVGFDAARRPGKGLGLRSMGERVRLVGGRLDVDSVPGRGTTVTVRIPIG